VASSTAQASLFAEVAEADVEAEASADVETLETLETLSAPPRDREEGDDEELAAAEPESGPRQSGVDPIREKLTALRTEVEGFLDELESDRSERA
jgi:hypothetical protein